MAWDTLFTDEFSFGYKDQSGAYDEIEAVDTNWMPATFPQVTVNREVFDDFRSTGQVMASSKRGVGGLSGSFTFRILARSQATGFDPSAASPSAAAPELGLLEEIMGGGTVDTVGGAFQGAIKAASVPTANTVDFDATYKLGCAYAFADAAAGAVPEAFGWLESLAGTVGTLVEDMAFIPDALDKINPLYTMYAGATAPTPKTFRLLGETAEQDVSYIGCMPVRATLEMDSGGQLYLEFEYTFTDMAFGSGGGLKSVTAYQTIQPLIGSYGSRAMIGSNVITTFDDGSAAPDGTCDISGLKLTINCAQSPVRCHAGAQGRSNMKIRRRTAVLEFTVPKVDEFNVGGENIFLTSLKNQSALAFSLQTGIAAGQCFACLMPAGFVVAEPGRSDVDGKYSYSISMEAGEYAGDGASTDAGNSALRLAFG